MRVVVLLSVVASLVLAGCGKDKQDPIKDYRHLPQQTNNGPETNQNILGGDGAFSFIPVNEKSGDSHMVHGISEGETGTYKIRVASESSEIKDFTVQSSSLPEGASLVKTDEQDPAYDPASGFAPPQFWVITWTPKKYTVPTDESNQTGITITLEALATAPNEERVLKLSGVHGIYIPVKKDPRNPEIRSILGLQPEMQEGKTANFTVEVYDPSGYAAAPDLDPTSKIMPISKERDAKDGIRFVKGGASHAGSSPGVWIYNYIFDTTNDAIPLTKDLNASKVEVCFHLRAFSETVRPSNAMDKCLFINYKMNAPKFKFGPRGANIQIEAGTSSVFNFSAVAPNNRGTVTIESLTDLTILDGQPSLKCDEPSEQNHAERQCAVIWNAPCKTTKYFIDLKATNTLGEKKASDTVRLGVEAAIIPGNDKCELPKPLKAAPKTPIKRAPAKVPAKPAPTAVDANPTEMKPAPAQGGQQ